MTSTIQKPTGTGLKYQPQISGLRICAVLFVMFYHYSSHLMNFRTHYDLGSFIVFFFVLSSYLITRILLNAKQKAVDSGMARGKVAAVFLFRRTLRIFPPYYFYLIILMLLPLAGAEARAHAAIYFSYLSNFLLYKTKIWENYTFHFWTLAVEEQFYIIWPWLILFIPTRRLSWLFGFLMLTAVVFRISMSSMMADRARELAPMLALTPACIDGFAIGALLACWHQRGHQNFQLLQRIFLFVAPVWIFLLISKTQFSIFVGIDRLFISLGAVLIIDKANRGYTGLAKRFLENPVTQYLSKISYGIFIYHMIASLFVGWAIVEWQERFGEVSWLQQPEMLHRSAFLLCLLTAIACASISWYCIEMPINKLRHVYAYFIPKRKSQSFVKKTEGSHSDEQPQMTLNANT